MEEYSSRKPKDGIYTPGSGNGSQMPSSDQSRIIPRQLSTGTLRGTQSVGYGNTKIDSSNNRITFSAADGSVVGMGAIPGSTTNEYGFFSLDTSGKLIMKIVNGTKYVYDPQNNYVNITQDGLLPDGSGGFVAAKPGVDVTSLFT